MSAQLESERFAQLLKQRAAVEAELESTFASAIRRMWPRYCELCGMIGLGNRDPENITFDLESSDTATLTVYYRGDYTSCDFPMRYLWSSNWEEELRADLEREAEERRQREEAECARKLAEQERRERETYEWLRAKYEPILLRERQEAEVARMQAEQEQRERET